jgi:hypothetical protein
MGSVHLAQFSSSHGENSHVHSEGSDVRGQTPSSMGESFFFSCTRHVSMYLRRGIVIPSFILSVPRGIIFY